MTDLLRDLATLTESEIELSGVEGKHLEKMLLLSACGIFIRTHHAEIARNAEDAERYRWLRGRVPGGTYRIMGIMYSEGGDGVDQYIDAAMTESGE